MNDIFSQIAAAGKSPLALTAYIVALGAWLLRIWLLIKPRRQAREILDQFKDDKRRLAALREVFGEQPPTGLAGNDAILAWARLKSQEQTRLYLLIAFLCTIIALVAVGVSLITGAGTKRADDSTEIRINVHRAGSRTECPPLPDGARLVVTIGRRREEVHFHDSCSAVMRVSSTSGGVPWGKVALENAGPYRVTNADAQYDLANRTWDVPIDVAATARLRISLFAYTAVDCSDYEVRFSTFRQILQAKLNRIRNMFDPADVRYNSLSGLSLVVAGKPLEMSATETHEYLQKTNSLQVLSGICFKKNRVDFMKSQIFFGPPVGALNDPLLAELPVTAEEFGAIQDIHTASVLYALAEDAHERREPGDMVIAYLSRAREIASQLDRAVAQPLTTAIVAALEKAGAPAPLKL